MKTIFLAIFTTLIIGASLAHAQTQSLDLDAAFQSFSAELESLDKEMRQEMESVEQAAEVMAGYAIAINICIILFFIGNQLFWIYILILLIRTQQFPGKKTWLVTVFLLNSLGAIFYLLGIATKEFQITALAEPPKTNNTTPSFKIECECCQKELEALPGKETRCTQCGRINTAPAIS